ncbi:hypothetical protein AWB68_01224 [Caballeronia choica]|uniref:Uncharacterized protein n=1 Tax=Caballeronia choica TaxID=326476 RepID=A0A158G345_9BURK|nr:hypothetical protein [Caballeronia choica]SAL26505.1 hypothetical protein AWB68_01224 [Caballeronia choica]
MDDETVIGKDCSHWIGLIRCKYSWNVLGLIKGISMVNCVSANLLMREHWIIDYRIQDPDDDGKAKRITCATC